MKTLLAVAMLVFSTAANAFNLEAGISRTYFNAAGDNIWWQDYMTHNELFNAARELVKAGEYENAQRQERLFA